MRNDRILRVLRPSLALAALAGLLVLVGLVVAGPAPAATTATPAPTPRSSSSVVLQRGTEVRFGEDVTVARGTRVPSVVVFGGDITVDGTVTEAVVAFGGNVVVNGTVGTSTVAFGGDVTVGPEAVVGRDLSAGDASLILFGGTLTQAPGATVVGETQVFDSVGWSNALEWAAKGVFVNPLWGLSFVGWVVQTAFFLVLALVAAALMPRQLLAVQRHLGRKPWASLGWGALAFFIVAPAILVVLVISIVGLLLVLPYALFVLLAYFFVTTGVASFLAQKVLTGFGGKENLMLAVTLGVVGTTVVSRIPGIGPLLLTGLMVFGVGAALLAVAEWRRDRREAAAALAAATAAASGAPGDPSAPGVAQTPAAGITPIVQTSPAIEASAVTAAAGTAVTEVAGAATEAPGSEAADAPRDGAAAEGVTVSPPPAASPEDAPAAEAESGADAPRTDVDTPGADEESGPGSP